MKEEEEPAMTLSCQHCGHRWEYRGKSAYYATCPKCTYKVNIEKNKITSRKSNINRRVQRIQERMEIRRR